MQTELFLVVFALTSAALAALLPSIGAGESLGQDINNLVGSPFGNGSSDGNSNGAGNSNDQNVCILVYSIASISNLVHREMATESEMETRMEMAMSLETATISSAVTAG